MSTPVTQIRATLRHWGTWLGFVGSVLVAWGALGTSFAPEPFLRTPVGSFLVGLLQGQNAGGPIVYALGIILLVAGFLTTRPGEHGPFQVWVAFALWTLPLLFTVAILSRDLYSYMGYSWILHQSADPYQVGLGVLPGPYDSFLDPVWSGVIAVYPALDLRLYQAVAWLGGFQVIPTVLLTRLPAVVGVVLIGLCLPDLARRMGLDAGRALWIALLNPITILHLIGGGHNDALMAGLAVVALWLAYRPFGLVTGAAVAGLSMGIKQPGLLAALIVAMIIVPAGPWLKRIGAATLSLAIALGVFVGSSVALRLGFGWIAMFASETGPGSVPTLAPLDVAKRLFLMMTDVNINRGFTVLGLILIVVISVWLVLRRWNQPFLVAWGIWTAYTLFSSYLHPWYFVTSLAIFGVANLSSFWRIGTVAFMAYLVMAGVLDQVFHIDSMIAASVGATVALLGAWLAVHPGVRQRIPLVNRFTTKPVTEGAPL